VAEGEERGGFQPKAWGKKHTERRFWQGSNSVAVLIDNIATVRIILWYVW